MTGEPTSPGPDADPASTKSPGRLKRRLRRGVTVAVLSVLTGLVGLGAHGLWREWRAMRLEVEAADDAAPIGFHNVYSKPSLAANPENWFRPEGNSVFLWSDWGKDKEHHWFQLDPQDLDRSRLAGPIGRDVIRPITDPWIEKAGGSIWGKMPPKEPVIGETLAGVPCAYPLRILTRMCVVNDVVENRPFLLLFDSTRPPVQSVGLFDAQLEGRRIILGTSGYLLDGKLLLYDRETESLWFEAVDSINAISGKRKGSRLPQIARPAPVAWNDWKSRSPNSRLLVGTHEGPH
jgi:hypothetical protein